MHQVLAAAQRQRREHRQARGPGAGQGVDLARRRQFVHQPVMERGLCIERLAEIDHLLRDGRRQQARQALRAARARDQPELDLRHTETRIGFAQAEIAREREFRHVFENRPDIGGRYSALSYFGLAPAALNFASARSPGGGFQSGARAQEESLCRASALYTCLQGQPFYEHHERQRDPLYSSWVIDAPQVPVFRDDDGRLLDEPWPCAFLTAAAPNVKALRERSPARLAEVGPAYTERIERVLSIAAVAGYRGLVLGAWGCGAFGGDADDVAARFAAALRGPFRGAFEAVVFAILDTSPEERFIGPFLRRFAG